jgi:hypothetical protein
MGDRADIVDHYRLECKSTNVAGCKGAETMLRKTHIRRPLAVLLMMLGAAMMYMAPQTWAGVLLLVLGVSVEAVGIALNRKE